MFDDYAVSKDEIPHPIPQCVAKHKKAENSGERQTYEIGVHKGNYAVGRTKEWKSSTVENIPTSNKSVTGKTMFNDAVENSLDCKNMSTGVSGVIINTPLVKELRNKGILIEGEETKRSKKISTENFTLKDGATTSEDYVATVKTPNTKRFFDASAKNDEKTGNDAFSVNENEITKILDDALRDFGNKNYTGSPYLSFGRSNRKNGEKTEFPKDSRSGEECFRRSFDHHEMYKNPEIKTLGDALRYFRLSSYLEQLEMSLEDVRRNRKGKEDHADFFKQIDKEIQKLSLKYHPDIIKNRGGTEKEIATAQDLQSAINVTRTVLEVLNAAFIEDIGIDHKFGFYTKLNICSSSNEDEIKYRIYEVIFKIGMVSRIKQQNIISEIRKFLIESRNCVFSYMENKNNFEKYRDLALFHLKCCIKGFKKLRVELKEVMNQCKSEKNGENMHPFIHSMARDSERNLELLKSLKKTAKASLKGKYQFFSPEGFMDPYFVLPLVSYTNVILMCNVMVRSSSVLNFLNFYSTSDPRFRYDLGYLMHPYYLASYCTGSKYHEETVLKIMNKTHLIQQGLELQINREEILLEFDTCIKPINEFMEYKFKIEDYNEAIPTNLLALDLKKCMTMMTEFQEKEQELAKDIKKFQKKTEKMDEKYERIDKIMQASEELNQKVQERLQQSKKLSEKINSSLSDKL